MRAPRPRNPLLIGLLLVASLATAGVVYGTAGSGITTTMIVQGNFGDIDVKTNFDGHKVDIDTKGDSDLYVVSNVIAPGGHTGWHTHPGPSLITVKSGTITAYQGDDPTCSPTVYTTGDGFIDPGDGSVHLLRNEGTVPAETIAVQLVPDGGTRRIDEPAPDSCPF
jgi:quercetin dioxygenase-like cupin family protein